MKTTDNWWHPYITNLNYICISITNHQWVSWWCMQTWLSSIKDKSMSPRSQVRRSHMEKFSTHAMSTMGSCEWEYGQFVSQPNDFETTRMWWCICQWILLREKTSIYKYFMLLYVNCHVRNASLMASFHFCGDDDGHKSKANQWQLEWQHWSHGLPMVRVFDVTHEMEASHVYLGE